MERFLRHDEQIYDENLPLMKIQRNNPPPPPQKKKKKISNIYTKLTSRYMFLGMTKMMK